LEQTFQQPERKGVMQAVWVEIPVRDLERAATFYQTVFGLPAGEVSEEGVRRTLTLVNPGENGAGISLNQTSNFDPSASGTLVYLQTDGDALEKIPAAGGKIVQEKTSMGEAGFYATVQDSEGNLLALYFAS
jgi:predicted enzyme related to lactoylglutathione lyase